MVFQILQRPLCSFRSASINPRAPEFYLPVAEMQGSLQSTVQQGGAQQGILWPVVSGRPKLPPWRRRLSSPWRPEAGAFRCPRRNLRRAACTPSSRTARPTRASGKCRHLPQENYTVVCLRLFFSSGGLLAMCCIVMTMGEQ